MTIKSLYYEVFRTGQRNDETYPAYEYGVVVEMQRLELPSQVLYHGFTTYIMTVGVSFGHEQEAFKHIQADFKSDAHAIRHAIETFDRHKNIIEQRLQQLQVEA
jgi:hypothetical protein